MVRKRKGIDEYYLDIARAVLTRATCLRRVYGVVVVKDKIVVSTGYCGAASGLEDCLERGVCIREQNNIPSGTRYELCRSVHAEANALRQAGLETKGAMLYICGEEADGSLAEGKPCSMCARLILNAGIEKVISRLKDGSIKYFTMDEIKRIADHFDVPKTP